MCAALQVGNATSTIRRGIAAMPCEFEGTESHTGKDKLRHTKQICTGNLLPCLVDTPMGHVTCTRRTWLLLQGCTPGQKPPKVYRRHKVSDLQGKLV
jgi:hypothetical protein